MQTNLAPFIKGTAEGNEAEAILRKCTHCGLCTAACPTYQLLRDELDGPRGRIYLMKQVLEGATPSARTQLHLDRCLTCRSCETTCPTGVQYARLLEIGRPLVEARVGRAPADAGRRKLLRAVIPSRRIFSPLLALGQLALPLLPQDMQRKVPQPAAPAKPWPKTRHARRVLLLESCAQGSVSPATNAAAARILDRVGITLVRVGNAGCCGAVSLHLSARDEALGFMRRNIDAWWPHIESGAEAVISTASGCGVTLGDYGHLLSRDPAYADKAKRVSSLARDISQVIVPEAAKLKALLSERRTPVIGQRVAFHSPCSLQHGMKLRGNVEALLASLGFSLTEVKDAHLCCGSAGTYSILQPELSQRLLGNKITALTSGGPSRILTANIGCQMHLQSATNLPVRHWIEALDDALSSP